MEYRRYRIPGNRFEIRTTSPRFAEWLDYALAAYQVRGKANPVYSIVISEGGDDAGRVKRFNILYRGAVRVVRSLNVVTVGRMLLGELESVLYHRRRDAIYLQAALLSANGRTALVPSTYLAWIGELGRHAERAGIQLPASKMVAVDRASGEVIPVPARLHVPPDALDRLAEMFPFPAPPERVILDRPVGVDVVYTVVSSEHDPLSPASRAHTLHHLAADVINGRVMGERTLRTLAGLVEGAQCYRLPLGDPRSMLQAIAGSLAQSEGKNARNGEGAGSPVRGIRATLPAP